MAHAVLGLAVGIVWLVLPGMTINGGAPVPTTRAGPVAGAPAAPPEDETSTTDLVLPLVVVVAVGALAAYGFVRRTRRARGRTTPAPPGVVSAHPPVPSLTALDEQSRAALVQADDCVRVSREELGFATALSGTDAVEPFARVVREAEAELAAAFAIRQRYDEGVPLDEPSRRHVLTGIVGRCAEAGRRLDQEAAAFDRLRGRGDALAVAEARFRELAARTGGTQATLAGLRVRYAPSATESVTGYVEQAKDRLVFATTHLNQAHQAADSGDGRLAARQLRTAEGAVAQAGVLLNAVDRLAGELESAAGLVPAALTGAEAELAGVRGASGEPEIRLARADAVLAAVREELTNGPYDPLDALRRIVRATAPLAAGRSGVLSAAARLGARSATADAEDYIATHRGAVGGEARTRLAEARRLLPDGGDAAADALALAARDLAERDVRAYGAAGSMATLSGILLDEEPDGGPPPSFGGPGTRARRHLPSEPDEQPSGPGI